MKEYHVTLDPQTPYHKPMRNILGMNNLPRITTKAKYELDLPSFKALKLGHIRFHDAPLGNPGQQLIDIHRIFPLFHLDESKEENYFFAQTDDYLRCLTEIDAEIDFRLGETIDHSGGGHLIGVPDDIEKWARICRTIIGHYKNGEMHGMHLRITRVSVWEEPDNSALFGGTVENYTDMFCAVYRLLKKDFPDLKVGAPNAMTYTFIDQFLSLCEKQGVRPDFISSTHYRRSVEHTDDPLVGKLESHLGVMDKHGLADISHTLTEWHYGVKDWNFAGDVEGNGFLTAENAAYTASALIALMDVERIDVAYYYSWDISIWAPFALGKVEQPLLPVYYGLLFFQYLAVECPCRVNISTDAPQEIKLLAGKTEDGALRLLISCHDVEDACLLIDAQGAASARLRSVTMGAETSESEKEKPLLAENGFFKIIHEGGHGVYLLELALA